MAQLRVSVRSLALSASLVFAVSCRGDRYQILERKDGTLVRLDRHSGQIMLLEGGAMTVVQEPTGNLIDSALGIRRSWPKQNIPAGDSTLVASLQTVWRSGNVYYQLTVTSAKGLQSVLRRSTTFGPQF